MGRKGDGVGRCHRTLSLYPTTLTRPQISIGVEGLYKVDMLKYHFAFLRNLHSAYSPQAFPVNY